MAGFHSVINCKLTLCLAADFADFRDWLEQEGLRPLKHRLPILILHPSQLNFKQLTGSLKPHRCYVTKQAESFFAYEECKHLLNAHSIPIFYHVPKEDLE